MKNRFIATLCLLLCLSLCACAIEPVANSGLQSTKPSQNDVPSHSDTEDKPDDLAVQSLTDGEVVLFETDECSLTAVAVDDQLPEVITFEFIMENKSDTELDFYCDSFAVNGWQADTFYYETVESGKTLRDTLEYHPVDMYDALPDHADVISISWIVTDAVDLLRDPLVNDAFVFSVTGLAPEELEIAERRTTDDETVILDDERFSFVVLDVKEDGILGPEVLCYLENKTDDPVRIGWDDTSVNGWAVSYYFSRSILPGCRAYQQNIFIESELIPCGIESIDALSFELIIEDLDYKEITSRSVSLYPTGLTADDIPEPERVSKEGELVLLENEQCTAILEPAVLRDGIYCYDLYIHNKSGEDIEIYITDAIVNGDSDISFFRYDYLPAGGQTYMAIEVFDFDLADSVSSTPDSLEFKMELGCFNGYSTEAFFDETVTFEN